MKFLIYGALLVGIVPIQTTILGHVSIAGIRPDLCLVTAVLVGFTRGPFEGLLMGVSLGYIQGFFSAGQLGINLFTKGIAGLLAGAGGKYVANATPVTAVAMVLGLSILSGVVFLFSDRAVESSTDLFQALWSILLLQSAYDAVVAGIVYRVIGFRIRKVQGLEHSFARLFP